MNATVQETLLELFQQVIEDPERMPAMPTNVWQESSEGERRLLMSFGNMVEHLQRSRQEAEEQLREKEAQYRAIFEASSDGLFVSDLEDGHIVEINPAACMQLGYTYEELIGLHPTTFIHPDSHHVFAESLQTIKAGGQFQGRGVNLRKDGTPFYVEVHSTAFTYKGKPHILGVVRDITERVEAEKQLREKEAQYRSIFEAITDALFINDMDGLFVEANPAACRMHGYSYEEFLGQYPTLIGHPDYHHLVAQFFQTIKLGGQFQARAVNVRKDGTAFPVEVHGTTFTYKGKPHTLAIVRDITEQVQAEEQLREREAQYRSIFEATTDALFINDMDGFFVEVNPAACRMYGYTYEELLGMHPSALTHPDSHHLVEKFLQTIKERSQYQARAAAFCKDGTKFYVEAHTTPFTYKGKPHILGVVRDITERVEAEEQLREREAQYRSIFEASSDGLLISDLDGFIVEVNPAACEMYGYAYEELIGLHGAALVPPEIQQRVAERLRTIQLGGRFTAQSVGLRKNGTPFHVEARGTPFTFKGKPHVLGVVRDITEQVQAQQLLEQRVEDRTRELSTLLEISHNVASTLELKPLLGLILDQLKTVVDYSGASILTLEGEDLVIVENRSRPYLAEQLLRVRFPLKQLGVVWEMLCRQESVIIDNVRGDTPLAQIFRDAVGELLETVFTNTCAMMGIPLTLKEQTIGTLVLTSCEPGYFTPRHAVLALAVANQAVVAIENARLYEQAQELAALEERQKLARELHDSVSQALYGISLGAHTARTALERDPSQLAEPLDYVLTLAEAALAEMRALIFEMRPESLEKEGLVSALTKQAIAIRDRNNIAISTELCDEPDLSLRVKQDLYRIAQEALHNTVKHAHASRVDLRLKQTSEAVMLEVRDDGVGFDTTAAYPGHLGLHSMRERVTNLGGKFEIASATGAGTCIWVRIPGHAGL